MWIPEPVSTWKERKSHFTPVVIIYTHTIREVTKMTVIEKVAYLRGLADGLKLTDTTAEGKVLTRWWMSWRSPLPIWRMR